MISLYLKHFSPHIILKLRFKYIVRKYLITAADFETSAIIKKHI